MDFTDLCGTEFAALSDGGIFLDSASVDPLSSRRVAARALLLTSGDFVVTVDHELSSDIHLWMRLETSGVTLERLPVTAAGRTSNRELTEGPSK